MTAFFSKFHISQSEWAWEEIAPSGGTEPTGRRDYPMFLRDGDSFLLIGGRNSGGSEIGDYWAFNYSTKLWTNIVASGGPPSGVFGFSDGSGTVYFSGESASGNGKKLNVTTGAVTDLTDTHVVMSEPGPMCADPSSMKTYLAGASGTNVYDPSWLQQKLYTSTTMVESNKTTSAQSPRRSKSSLALNTSTNVIYLFAPSISPYTGAWTLSSNDILKYDLTAGSGWSAETGVTNNAGSILLGGSWTNMHECVWSSSESKFFLFVNSNGSMPYVLTYDPSTKVLAQLQYSGTGPTYFSLGDSYGQSRGNAGTVVVGTNEFFVIPCDAASGPTNARIHRLYRV